MDADDGQPLLPEDRDGFEDRDGVPDPDKDGDGIADVDDIASRSFELLNNVASVLKVHPEIKKVRFEGHTDSQGSEGTNQRLSQRRAESVVAYRRVESVIVEGDSSGVQP